MQHVDDADDADGGKLAVLYTQQAIEDWLNQDDMPPGLPYLVNAMVLSSDEQTGEIRYRMLDGALCGAVLRIQVSLVEPPTPDPPAIVEGETP